MSTQPQDLIVNSPQDHKELVKQIRKASRGKRSFNVKIDLIAYASFCLDSGGVLTKVILAERGQTQNAFAVYMHDNSLSSQRLIEGKTYRIVGSVALVIDGKSTVDSGYYCARVGAKAPQVLEMLDGQHKPDLMRFMAIASKQQFGPSWMAKLPPK